MTNNWAYALAVEKLTGPGGAGARRISPRHLGRADAPAQPQLPRRISAPGLRLQRDPADVRLPRAREDPRPVRGAQRLADDVQLPALRRLPGGSVPDWLEAAERLVDGYGRFLDEFEELLTGNEILMARTQGVGRLPAALAISAGVTGPMLRAAGVAYDLRKVDGYGIYPRFNFRVPLGAQGDTYDRYMIRILEMRESIPILQQALRELPAGPILDSKAKLRGLRPKAGRGLRPDRGPQGRDRLLPDQRRRAQPLPLSGARPVVSSTSPSSRTCASGTPSPTRSSSSDHRHRPRRGGPLTRHARIRNPPRPGGHREEPHGQLP